MNSVEADRIKPDQSKEAICQGNVEPGELEKRRSEGNNRFDPASIKPNQTGSNLCEMESGRGVPGTPKNVTGAPK